MLFKKRFKKSKLYHNMREFYYTNIYAKLIPKEKYIRNRFKKNLGRDLELENPVYFNDKLQWLKLNWRDPVASSCADKYGVRGFVEKKIGKGYLNELYGVYDSVEEINLDKLPNSFVLKGTHGSGFNIICKDKMNMDWDSEFKKMRRWMKTDYTIMNQEWVYKDITPRIICERYIEQDGGEELLDYRFFCFNGTVKFVSIDFNITNKLKTRRNLYDLDWNLLEAEITYPKEKKSTIKKPKKLDEMIQLSEILSSGFPHARVDFYYVRDKIIFGEITFFHQSGLGIVSPLEYEKQMGSWLKLPKK